MVSRARNYGVSSLPGKCTLAEHGFFSSNGRLGPSLFVYPGLGGTQRRADFSTTSRCVVLCCLSVARQHDDDLKGCTLPS